MRLLLSLTLFFTFSSGVMAEGSTTWVTAGEYSDFLNAVAPADPHTLYHETMDEIARTGEPGDYHYEAIAGGENLPITFVTWFDEARYCNWREHGSPARDEATPETTETGSYTLNDDMSGRVMKHSGAHYFLSMSEEDSFIDPTLASNDRGFYIVEVEGGDRFNAASFLGASHSADGTWSTFDEVIGVVGVLGVIGTAGYAYHRCRANEPHEGGLPSDGTVDVITAANRRVAEDQLNSGPEEVEGGTSVMVDDVTGTQTETKDFAQDQRSLVKKWADWLRGQNHRNSIFQDADQIDYIQNEDLTSPEDQSRFQKFIRWMTQRAYTYKDVEDFKNRNPEYLKKIIEGHTTTIAQHTATIAQHETTIAQHETTIAQHGETIAQHTARIAQHEITIAEHPAVAGAAGHLATIAELQQKIQGHEQTQQEEKEEEDQARRARITQFQEDQTKLHEVTQLILKISKLEPLCYSAAATVVQHASSSSATARVQESSLTPFQMLREATQYLVIKKLQDIEKVAQGSQHADGEEIAAGQIQTQYYDVCKADAELMERLAILMSKKELLWKYLAEMGDDFVERQRVVMKVKSIESKIPDIQSSIGSYPKVIQDHFGYAKKIFDGDQQSNFSRESNDRKSVGDRSSIGGSAEKKPKTGMAKLFHFSSGHKELTEEEVAAAIVRDLRIETACRELGERIVKQFTETVYPITDRVEKLFTQSYEMLHLAEKNALLGSNLIRLCEADQGRKLWETCSLRPYLTDALTRARVRVTNATTLLVQEKNALGGTWKKQEDGNSHDPIYHYQAGGWQTFTNEAAVMQEMGTLQTRTQKVDEGKLNLLARKIEDAKTIEGLLEAAKTKAGELLSNTTIATNLETKRAAFLAAMKDLLSHPVLQSGQQLTNQGQGSEQKENGSI